MLSPVVRSICDAYCNADHQKSQQAGTGYKVCRQRTATAAGGESVERGLALRMNDDY